MEYINFSVFVLFFFLVFFRFNKDGNHPCTVLVHYNSHFYVIFWLYARINLENIIYRTNNLAELSGHIGAYEITSLVELFFYFLLLIAYVYSLFGFIAQHFHFEKLNYLLLLFIFILYSSNYNTLMIFTAHHLTFLSKPSFDQMDA